MRKVFGQFIAVGILALLTTQPVHAVFLSLVPTSATVTTGNTVNVDVFIFGLGNPPSVGAFDLHVGFASAILSPTAVTFGPFLGDPLLFEALTGFDFSTPGTVEFAEVSLLSPSALDALQSSSFLLATLSFTAIDNGTSAFIFVGNQIVDDAFGNKLLIPEPPTAILLGLGLVAVFGLMSKRALPTSSPVFSGQAGFIFASKPKPAAQSRRSTSMPRSSATGPLRTARVVKKLEPLERAVSSGRGRQ